MIYSSLSTVLVLSVLVVHTRLAGVEHSQKLSQGPGRQHAVISFSHNIFQAVT